MAEWPTVRFEEIAAPEKSAFSKPYGSAYTRNDYVPSGIPLVRGVNLGAGPFHDDDFVFISSEKADTLPGANLKPGDLVITHRGTIGQVSMIPRNPRHDRYVLSTSQVKARLDRAKAVPEFYYYWLLSPVGQKEILQHVSTVGVPGLVQPVATVKSFKVPVPSLDEQRSVVALLGSLDDKIAVNERIAAVVDDLAAALFEALLTADSEGAEVLLGDVADVNVRTVKAQDAGSLRYVDISSVGVGSYEWPAETSWSDAPGRARRKTAVGDTIWSTVRPNRRSHALVLDADPDLVFSTGLAVLSPKVVGSAFLYESTRLASFHSYLESVAEGSAYPAVRADRFKGAPITLPSEDARFRFEETAMPMRLRAHQAQVESRTLAALRDTLLPQLMSGRICVKGAEKIVEDHV